MTTTKLKQSKLSIEQIALIILLVMEILLNFCFEIIGVGLSKFTLNSFNDALTLGVSEFLILAALIKLRNRPLECLWILLANQGISVIYNLANGMKLDKAINDVLDQGYRTGDIFTPGLNDEAKKVGTKEMGDLIVQALK